MAGRISLLLITFGLLTEAIFAESPVDRHVWLSAKLYHGYLMVVEGSIGGEQHRTLLIDTAAYPSVIDEDLARKLRLSSTGDQVRLVGGSLKSAATVVPVLQVGPVTAHDLPVQVQDLRAVGKKIGTHLDALIGLDVLGHSNFRIDYAQAQLVFGPVGVLPASAPLRQIDGMTCVDTRINGQVVHLLVGSAASGVTVLGDRAPHIDEQEGKAHKSTNLGGRVSTRQVHVERLALGGTELGPREIFVTAPDNLAPLPFDGLLGTGTLGFGQVAFDFEHQVLSWQTSETKKRKTTALQASRTINPNQPPLEGSDPMSEPPVRCPSLQGASAGCTSIVSMPQR